MGTKEGRGQCGTPAYILKVRDGYKEMLQQAKRGAVETPRAVADYESMANSQLGLF